MKINTPPIQRSSNLELFRIICMLLIVAHHYVVNSGLLSHLNCDPLTLKSLSFYWLGMWGKTGINCFVLITGYFMCKSQITMKKVLKLLFEVEFYIFIIWFLFWIFGYNNVNIKDLIKTQIGNLSVSDNFCLSFVYFYLFIPFLNVLVHNINKRQHELLLMLCFFMYVILGTIFKIEVRMNYVEWFCVLYLMSSYIRLYDFPFNLSTRGWLLSLHVCVAVSMGSVFMMALLLNGELKAVYYFVSDANHIMAVAVSLSFFMLFKTIKMSYNKYVNWVAQSVFGVLLIHANCETMRYWLWKDVVNVMSQYQQDYALFRAFITIVAIFVICIIIDQLRLRLIEKPIFSFIEFKAQNNKR